MTTHKNRVGQAGVGVNGGEFAKKNQTADAVELPGDELAPIRLARLYKQREDLDAQIAQARVDVIRYEITYRFPSAENALIVSTNAIGTGWELTAVLDADANPVWRFEPDDFDENDWEFYNLVRYELLGLAESGDLVPNVPAVRDTTLGPKVMHANFHLYQRARVITVPRTTHA